MSYFIELILFIAIIVWLTLWLVPLETYLSFNRNTDGKAVYLEKRNMFGSWEKTSLFFGYYNNLSACSDFKNTYTKKYYADQYRCTYVE